jgi:hypothetical protein
MMAAWMAEKTGPTGSTKAGRTVGDLAEWKAGLTGNWKQTAKAQ